MAIGYFTQYPLKPALAGFEKNQIRCIPNTRICRAEKHQNIIIFCMLKMQIFVNNSVYSQLNIDFRTVCQQRGYVECSERMFNTWPDTTAKLISCSTKKHGKSNLYYLHKLDTDA